MTPAQWIWFLSGVDLGMRDWPRNPEGRPDPNDPEGCEWAIRLGINEGRMLRARYANLTPIVEIEAPDPGDGYPI